MAAKYYVTLTDYGATRVAQAHNVASILLTELVIGDANGLPYDPVTNKSRTTLVNQKSSVPVQSVTINDAVTTVMATITANIGGFNLHEIGLKDNTGKLVYIGNYHGGYKPVIADGAGGDLTIAIDITAESGKDVMIQVDPTVVTANKQWVIDNFVRIPTFDAHVSQNALEHNNLLTLIQAEAQTRYNNDNSLSNRVHTLEIAPPIDISSKYDKSGGQISGNVSITGTATIEDDLIAKDKIKLITPPTVSNTEADSTVISHGNGTVYFDTSVFRYSFDKPVYFGGHAPSPNGWTMLPNGYILQWGEIIYSSVPAEADVTVNFPISFPNACFSMSLVRHGLSNSENADGGALLVSKNKISAKVLLQSFNNVAVSDLRGFGWIAIGN